MTHSRFRGIGLGAVAVLVLGAVGFLAYSPPSVAKPTVSWSPPSIYASVGAGESTTTHAVFTATADATNVDVRVVPEIAPYVTVTPTSFASVQKGMSYPINVTVSALATAPLGTTTGTIQLKQGNATLAKPLPVSVDVVWPTVKADSFGISFRVPPQVHVAFDEEYQEYSITLDLPGIPISDVPGIYVSLAANPGMLPISEYFDGDPGIDYFGQSDNVFEIFDVGGVQSYVFEPYITSSYSKVVIIPRGNDFVVIFDSGLTVGGRDPLADILASMEVQ